MTLNYNEVVEFMKAFGIDYLNCFDELIIDSHTDVYASIKNCDNIEDVKVAVVYALCRPIGKGLKDAPAKRLLLKVNAYFDTKLTKEDMRLMYSELCYIQKLAEFKVFIRRGFPIEELRCDHKH